MHSRMEQYGTGVGRGFGFAFELKVTIPEAKSSSIIELSLWLVCQLKGPCLLIWTPLVYINHMLQTHIYHNYFSRAATLRPACCSQFLLQSAAHGSSTGALPLSFGMTIRMITQCNWFHCVSNFPIRNLKNQAIDSSHIVLY
jgi:hypothetical protein